MTPGTVLVYVAEGAPGDALAGLDEVALRHPGPFALQAVVGDRTVTVGTRVAVTEGLLSYLFGLGRVEIVRPFESGHQQAP